MSYLSATYQYLKKKHFLSDPGNPSPLVRRKQVKDLPCSKGRYCLWSSWQCFQTLLCYSSMHHRLHRRTHNWGQWNEESVEVSGGNPPEAEVDDVVCSYVEEDIFPYVGRQWSPPPLQKMFSLWLGAGLRNWVEKLTQKADHMFWGRFSEFWYQASGEARSHRVVPGEKVAHHLNVWFYSDFSFSEPPSSMLLLRSVSFILLLAPILSICSLQRQWERLPASFCICTFPLSL